MPVLWRYLLTHFLRVFILCVVAFVTILLAMRLEEIASFATLGPEGIGILWFTFQQIPYILPIAMPISALISSILLVKSLSQAHELTAFRACGFSLRDIITPILIAAIFLSILNFYIVSELSTTSHLNAGLIKDQLRSVNPLHILNNKHLMRTKGLYFDALGSTHVGEFAEDVLLFSPGRHGNRLNFLVAKKFESTPQQFIASQLSLLTSKKNETSQVETLILENMNRSTTNINEFSQMLERKTMHINNDYLRLPQLLIVLGESRNAIKQAIQEQANPSTIKQLREPHSKALSEIMRRFSASLAVFSFTMMGIAFGMTISRNQSNRSMIYVIVLGTLFLSCFFIAKNLSHVLVLTTVLYLGPHLIICATSLWMMNRISRGIE